MKKKLYLRILSFLLLAASLLSLFPVSATATNEADVQILEDSPSSEAAIEEAIKRQNEASDGFDYTVAPPIDMAAQKGTAIDDLNPDQQALDLQPLYNALTLAVDFADAQGFAPELYAAFLQRLQEAVIFYGNCNDPQKLSEMDVSAAEKIAAAHEQVLSAYCAILIAMEEAGTDYNAQLLAALNALEEAAPANEYIYVPDVGEMNMAGDFYVVNELTDAEGNAVFYALDPITPSLYGKMTAKEVELFGTVGTGADALRGTSIKGLHPEMALTLEAIAGSGNEKRYYARVGGEYEYLDTPTYLSSAAMSYQNVYYVELLNGTLNGYGEISSRINLDVRSNGRLSFTFITPKDGSGENYCQYLALNTMTPGGEVYFEINTNTSNIAGSQTVYETYYKDKLPMVSSHLYRRLEDRVYTEQLRDSLLSYAAFLDNDARYESVTYENFLMKLQKMIALYLCYNGVSVSDRDAVEAEVLEEQEDMLAVTSQLKINKQSEAGTKINNFKASIYRWDEAEYNALTLAKDTASTKKGFYFTNSHIAPSGVTLPIWSRWDTSAGYCEYIYQSTGNYGEEVKQTRRYAIDSGLAKESISSTGSIINTSKTLEGIDLWGKTPLTSNGKKVREVYNNVSVPFIYDNATGYYTLDSDSNGVYFDGDPKNNGRLKIADRPLSNSRFFSVPETGGIDGQNERTYGIYNEYVASFHPFAEISLREWKNYPSSSVAHNAEPSQLVDSYLPHGIATNQNYVTDYGDLGKPQWGTGMLLEVPFRITEDGKLDGEAITFNFSGDDDVWVYIDNQLVLDIGGTHDAIQGKIDFSTGTVYVSSASHTYIRDNSGTYGKDSSLYNFASVMNIQNPDGSYTEYGGALGHNSIISMKDGSQPVRMYQKNIYTAAMNGTAASESLVKAFSEEGAHTLKIYYMDRGRGRTNCKISFNMPPADTVVVEKEINEYYGNLQTGGITTLKISDSQMEKLRNQSYTFTAYCNDVPMANTLYNIMEDGAEVGSGMTDANGKFTILGKQTAEFRGSEFSGTNTYRVEEDKLNGNWISPTYHYNYLGTAGISAESGEGNSYCVAGDPEAVETLHLVCKNSYSIAADPIDVVVDYGRPVEVEFRSRAMSTAVSKQSFANASVWAELENPDHAAYGDFVLYDSNNDNIIDSLRYTPKKMLPGIITIYCIFSVGGSLGDAPVPVRIIPATTVYYETDFSQSAFENKVVGNDDEDYQWKTITDSGEEGESGGEEETQSVELQDGGYTQEGIEKFVFDRGGEIPSNAFFADFDNDDAAKERYSRDRTYKNTGVANGYVNYDEAADGSHATKWSYGDRRSSQPTLWWARGRMHFNLVAGTSFAYIQTGPDLHNNFCLNYHPEPEHYTQVRFRMQNVAPQTDGGEGYMEMIYYIGSNHTEGKNDGVERAYSAGRVNIPNEAFHSGEFITLSIPMSGMNQEHTKITAIRITFGGLKNAEGATGSFEVDYVYCGPSTSRSGTLGMDQETSYAPYLYFNFDGGTYAQRRYANESAYGGIKDYDTNLNRWVIATNKNVNKDEHINFATTGIAGGVATFQAGPRDNSDGQYGSYISPSKNKENFPWGGDTADYCLTFKPNKSLSYYAIVRFKLGKMKQVSGQQAKLQFTLIDDKDVTKHPSTNFTFSNGNWIEVAVPLSSSLNELSATIKSFYVRPANVTTNSTTEYGTIEIDYIYVGTMIDNNANLVRESGYDYDANSTSLFVDFTNTTYDKDRYTHRAYAHTNLDIASGWNNTWWYNYSFDNNKGVLTLTPTADYTNWGQIEANTSDRAALLNYRMTGNDYAVVRMRFKNMAATGSPSLRFVVGSGSKAGLPGDSGVTAAYADAALSTSNNNKWVTYTINLAAAKATVGNKVTFFRLVFNSMTFNSGGSVEIDYIYVGPLLKSDPPEDTIYFGFENTQTDKDRYNSATYNYINYDDPANVSKFGFVNVESASIDNVTGTMTMVASPDVHSTFGFCPTNKLRYHPKNKTVQMRFKLEDFVLLEGGEPYIYLQYNTSYTHAGPKAYFSEEYLTNGKYVTVTLDLNEQEAAEFNNQKYVDRVRFVVSNIVNAPGKQGKITVDYAYIGPKDRELKEYGVDPVYGYDSSYANDLVYSDGSTLFVEGSGVPHFYTDGTINPNSAASKIYTESCFTFTGTGFDIISRTGKNQGSVRAMVYDQEGNFVKSTQVMNTSESNLELQQIPVLSVHMKNDKTGEPIHDTYTVKLYVPAAYKFDDPDNLFGGALDRGGEFYFDAVRIYNTIDTAANTTEAKEAAAVYRRHGEANVKYTEIRQYLIDAESFSPVVEGSSVNGVVFLDNSGKEATIGNYSAIGPNNEVYLDDDNAIAFLLEASGTIPASVDIGAKIVRDTATTMRVIADSKPNASGGQSFNIATGVLQNYAINFDSTDWVQDGTIYRTYITIVNDGAGLLSLTTLKSAYDVVIRPAQHSVRLLVDRTLSHSVECTLGLSYVDLQDGTHRVTCLCDYAAIENHSYVDGLCVCGAVEITEPVLDSNLTFGAQLYLENDLTMAFRVKTDKLNAYDISTAYLVVERDVYETGAKDATVEEMTISDYKIENGRLIFSYPGIAAAQMNDAIRASFYIKDANGQEYVSPVLNTSVATYLDGLLSASASDSKMVTLIMDMLNYGAAAQVYFDRHADAPVNEAYESFQTYASYASADFTKVLENLATTENAEGKSGKLNLGLDLGTRIGIQYKVTVPSDVNVEDVTLVVTDASGNVLETLQVAGNLTDHKGRYLVNFYGFTSRDMRRVVCATAYAKSEAITGTYAYSISTYAWGVQENASLQPDNLVNVTRAMHLYGDSAAAYFA